ncbi:MAG: hypothetical protein ABFS24_08685 [Pseudomonadota bacterium]
MKIQSVIAMVSAIVLMTLQGCATISGIGAYTNAVTTNNIPAADPGLDHYIAWVPREKAQTASVAEAVTHISLVNARERTAKQLCGGNWVMNSEATANIGPLPTTAPEAAGGYPAWYYRISHRPGLRGCPGTDPQKLYHMLQANLPEWLDIKTARTTNLSLLE